MIITQPVRPPAVFCQIAASRVHGDPMKKPSNHVSLFAPVLTSRPPRPLRNFIGIGFCDPTGARANGAAARGLAARPRSGKKHLHNGFYETPAFSFTRASHKSALCKLFVHFGRLLMAAGCLITYEGIRGGTPPRDAPGAHLPFLFLFAWLCLADGAPRELLAFYFVFGGLSAFIGRSAASRPRCAVLRPACRCAQRSILFFSRLASLAGSCRPRSGIIF